MPPHALSKEAHARINSHSRQQKLSDAKEAWQKTLSGATSRKSTPPKLPAFLKNYPGVKHTTFRCHLEGGISRREYAATCQHLTTTQTKALIKFIIEMGEKGFPLTLKKVSEYALAMIRVKSPQVKAIGAHWAQHFVNCYETEIGTKTCLLLDQTHAKALNPTNVAAHFQLLSETIQKFNITQQNLYNCDETGCPLNVPFWEKVVVSRKSKSKQAQAIQSTSKEHITVLEFICADGSALQPVVIFPGEYMMSNWKQKNPLGMK